MTHISQAHAQIINLCNVAKHHLKTCEDADCGVSLWQLREVALGLVNKCWGSEQEEVKKKIEEMPWI